MKFRTLYAHEIECRVARCSANRINLLLYKDARCDMNMLDEVIGPAFWQREHREAKGNLFCGVSIYLNLGTEDKPDMQWVTKWDAGAESYTEKEKGEASDSFKRACFNWGIGRELYTAPNISITVKNDHEIKSKETNGKKSYSTYTKFYVKEIGYSKERNIDKLVIIDESGQIRFSMGRVDELSEEMFNKFKALNLSVEDTHKWLSYYKVELKPELDTLDKLIRCLNDNEVQFIIDRFKKIKGDNK